MDDLRYELSYKLIISQMTMLGDYENLEISVYNILDFCNDFLVVYNITINDRYVYMSYILVNLKDKSLM